MTSITWNIFKMLLCLLSKSLYIRKEQVMIRKLYLIVDHIIFLQQPQTFISCTGRQEEAGQGSPGSDTRYFSPSLIRCLEKAWWGVAPCSVNWAAYLGEGAEDQGAASFGLRKTSIFSPPPFCWGLASFAFLTGLTFLIWEGGWSG